MSAIDELLMKWLQVNVELKKPFQRLIVCLLAHIVDIELIMVTLLVNN